MSRTAPVCKLGHLALSTPDLARSLSFFRDLLGLDVVAEHDGAFYLRAWGEHEHHSLILREGPTAVDHFALRASGPEQLELIAADLQAHDVATAWRPAGSELGQGDAIQFVSPQGHPYEIYWEIAPGRRDSALANQWGKAYQRGAAVRRLDHINVTCADAAAGEEFLHERLGFLRREFVKPTNGPVIGSWMSVTSQVHDIAITLDPHPPPRDGRLHHLAYALSDRGDMFRAAEVMRDAGVKIDLAPGRHGLSQAMFCYVHDPGSDHRVEIYAGGYHIFDPDWEPVEWNEHNIRTGMVWWGPDCVLGGGGPMDATTPCLAGSDPAQL
jgi:biphenyl-2,3-diol 1,2-dioxygenase